MSNGTQSSPLMSVMLHKLGLSKSSPKILLRHLQGLLYNAIILIPNAREHNYLDIDNRHSTKNAHGGTILVFRLEYDNRIAYNERRSCQSALLIHIQQLVIAGSDSSTGKNNN